MAPEAIQRASWQVDIGDGPWREGVVIQDTSLDLVRWNRDASAAAARCRAGAAEHAEVDAFGDKLNAFVADRTRSILAAGAIPAVLGGDHSVPVGAVWAAAEAHPGLGLLHVDAHADLREAYEGLRWSHASAVRNMLSADVSTLVSVGLRDVGLGERRMMAGDPRIWWWEDRDMAQLGWSGVPWPETCRAILEPLPEQLWITFDVDGLEPSLCPGTGTPVPGGLDWRSAMGLLDEVRRSGRTVVGFDLVEVGSSDWDANVGARLLWALAACAVGSR